MIEELKVRNSETEIDLVIISGDLVDKGGSSLKKLDEYNGYDNPYDIFEKEFIEPICTELKIAKEKILFIPGNHDIEQDKIDEIKEAGLKSILVNPQEANRLCHEYKEKLESLNFDRLDNFLKFEEEYHKDNRYLQYKFSAFESKVVYKYGSRKVGIALINDSWRCGKGKVEDHFMGINQFHRCLIFFEENDTELNIAVMHHPLDVYERYEKEEIDNLLHTKKFEVLLIGHEHSKKFEGSDFGNNQKILFTRGRSAFDKPHEKEVKYTSGYTIVNVDFSNKSIKCHYKIYDKESFRFYDDPFGGGAVKAHQYDISEHIKEKINDKGKNFFMGLDKNKFINNPDNE